MSSLTILILIISRLLISQENLYIKTSDNCLINIEIKITTNTKIVLFQIHGLGSNKDEWKELNKNLDDIGYVSIDLRAHGKSTNCKEKEIKYPKINQNDINLFIRDVDAVYNYLIEKYKNIDIIPIGASIGANISMKYFYKKAKKIILLSPGLNYGGYEIAELFKNTKANIFLITSQTDIYSLNSTRIFMEILQVKKRKYTLILAKKGHGVEIFNNDENYEYFRKIKEWIKN